MCAAVSCGRRRYVRSARGYTTRVKEVEGIEESLALVVANGCRHAADGATVAWHRRADELGMKAAAPPTPPPSPGIAAPTSLA